MDQYRVMLVSYEMNDLLEVQIRKTVVKNYVYEKKNIEIRREDGNSKIAHNLSNNYQPFICEGSVDL